jgi:sialate O-acetylesterase
MIPPSWSRADQILRLGPIDDIDTVWVNGTEVGSTKTWNAPREYFIPRDIIKTGPNLFAVRVVDTGGAGGMWGSKDQMTIGPEKADLKQHATMANTWKYKLSYEGTLPSFGILTFNQNSPTVLYNAMLAPLIPYRIAGAIWYQGESNVGRYIQYQTLFPAMIEDWRTRWDIGPFPFYFTQIAPFAYDGAPQSQYLRESQLQSLATPNTGIAVTMDIGQEKDIHPKNKQDVGQRLALWALAKTYGKDITYSGPLYKEMRIEGDAIRLYFEHTDSGLVAKDGPLTDFTIAGEDQQFVAAEAKIKGPTVLVSSPDVKKPVAVRYGWSDWTQPNLYNQAGLPASSFRTDDW